jgi:condensin complex subunit 1
MVDILLERARDKSSYTRSKVLQTWANLCVESAVSIGHWNLVAHVAAGRLEDKAAIVRKGALQLLTTLLQFNPFGPSLRAGPFEATLEQYKEKLKEMESTSVSSGEAEAHLAEPEDGVDKNTAPEEEHAELAQGTPDTQYDYPPSPSFLFMFLVLF